MSIIHESGSPEAPAASATPPANPPAPRLSRSAGVPLDAQTVARAVLTYCIDGADALMYALIKGAGDALRVLRLLIAVLDAGDADDAGGAARRDLDDLFATGVARWGRRVNERGMQAFHTAVGHWLERLRTLPARDGDKLVAWLTNGATLWIIAPHSPYWPQQLADLSVRADWAPPLCLWGRGDPAALVSCDAPLAIVGSRAANDYGSQTARRIAQQAADNGHLVISGGAMGIDAAAHWGALSTISDPDGTTRPGTTVAVFAGGLNHIGPQRNRQLFDQIVRRGGALISELCPDTVPEARRFLLRNRLIAALAANVVVAQARLRSGALNTAGWALELERTVYALPGDITMPNNAGCNKLIHDGKAVIVRTVDCIEEICHPAHPRVIVDGRTTAAPPAGDSSPTSLVHGPSASSQPPSIDTSISPSMSDSPPASAAPPISDALSIPPDSPISPTDHDPLVSSPQGAVSAPPISSISSTAHDVSSLPTPAATSSPRNPSAPSNVPVACEPSAPPSSSTTAPSTEPPDDSSTAHPQETGPSASDSPDAVLAAIRMCTRNRQPATVDAVQAALAAMFPNGQPSLERMLTQLAVLELEGRVSVASGRYAPV